MYIHALMQDKSNQLMITQQQFTGVLYQFNCTHNNKYSFAPHMLYNARSSHFTLPVIKMLKSMMDAHYTEYIAYN
jgi:hypothetical protein